MDRFVVGTGRCGSTLLSQMLARHPAVTSLFEFFNGLDMTRRFASEPVDGETFAELVSQAHPFVTMVLARGYDVPEVVYPFGPGARFSRKQGLPWLLVSLLSRLSDRPDECFDEIRAELATWPRRHLREHYRALFDHLTWRDGGRVWIERSGSAIDYVASLDAFFPEARFVHIHRDGPEAALSIREHPAFRLAVTLSTAHLRGAPPSLDQLSEYERGEEIDRQLKLRPDAEHFGAFWSAQLARGVPMLEALGPARVLDLRFEDLVEAPERELARICDFFALEVGAGRFLRDASGLVRGMPPARAPELPAEERARLEAACASGMRLLGRA